MSQTPPPTAIDELDKQAWTAVQSAAEWDDRTSPDGYEEYLFFKPDELHQILVSFFETVTDPHASRTPNTEMVVAKLEWDGSEESGEWIAETICGRYMVSDEGATVVLRFNSSEYQTVIGEFGTEQAAFAAAQADFDQRIRSALASPPSPAEVTFQDRVAEAHIALFHDDPTDLPERRDRFYEEATEAVQSLGMTEDEAHQLVSYTFSRPPGDVRKEIGAAALTLASLCVVGGWDMMECAEGDLAALRTPEKIAKVRAKRATRHGRGPLPGLDAALQLGKKG